MRSPVIIAALSVTLAACAGATGDASHDYYGNLYPADCPASIVNDESLLARVTIVRAHVSGAYGTATGSFITISPALSGWMLEDVTRHELCHVIKGDWHARHVPNVYRPKACPDTFHCN